MKFRDYYFKREATISDADTLTIDINVKQPISYISIEYEATTGATSCLDREIHDDVSAIELVDGSDVIASLSMLEWRGLNFAERGILPRAVLTEAGGAKQEESCVIYFGRHANDLEYYLDPNKYRNLQLRLTHALTISATVGFTTGSGKVTVRAGIIDEGALPRKGQMMAKRVYGWTSAGSGDEAIDMPRDYSYRQLLVKSVLTLTTPQEIIEKVKLSCDADKYIPVNTYLEDVVDENNRRLGMAKQDKIILRANDGSALTDIYDIANAHARSLTTDRICFVELLDAEKVAIGLLDLTAVGVPAWDATARSNSVVVEGAAPHGMLAVPFGSLTEPAGWLPAQTFGDVKLCVTQLTAGAACAVILQQIRT